MPLQPRPLAVLAYLATRAGEVVPGDELLRALWPGIHVTRAVLKVAVHALREALGDDAAAPRWIETVGREGYRFIGSGAGAQSRTSDAAGARGAAAAPDPVVGRASDLARLEERLRRTVAGERGVVLVSGEAGIGKTTLLDRFVRGVERGTGARVARGQCLEHFGEGEAYLPLLEAVGGLARGAGGERVRRIVAEVAPTWVPLLPAIGTAEPRPRRGTAASTAARMLRELVDALDALAQSAPLVLVLEDLQWSDRSTVDVIGAIARRRTRARLLVVGTLRPVDVILQQHPVGALRTELRAKGLCDEIVLESLTLDDVTAWLDARLAGASTSDVRTLAARIHERTEGNPLFVVNLLGDLVERGVVVLRDGAWTVRGPVEQATEQVPSGLRSLIGRRMDALSPLARRTLEAASVVGDEFAVAAVAAGLDAPVESVEDECETLAAQEMVIADDGLAEWPDGTISGRYRFVHALYRQVLHDGIGESRRARLHRAVGERLEAALGAQASEHAAELAMHFTRGRDHARALRHHEAAATAALHRSAHHEAVMHLQAALDELPHVAADPARDERELGLAVASATALMAVRGYASPETESAFARARALCESARPGAQSNAVLRGLVSFHHVRAELDVAHDLGELLLRHAAANPDDATLATQAHYGHGATLFHEGAFEPARVQLEAALARYDRASHREHVRAYGGYDPGVACSLWLAWTLGLIGRLEEAARRSREGLELAHALGEPFSLSWAHYATSVSQQLFGDWAASEASAGEAARLADEHGFPHVRGMALANQGWSQVMQGRVSDGIASLGDGIALVDETGAALVRPQYLGMLAAADALQGDVSRAERRFDEGLELVERTGERLHEVGLLLGKSQLLVSTEQATRTRAKARADAAEGCLRRALDTARGQGALLLELRVALALARHLSKRDRPGEARTLLAAALERFADARALVPEIAAGRRLLVKLEEAGV
ncbi:MAG: AAA family ATPase [Candidatus Binatia bacterium]